MPTVNPGETREEFVKRCIPQLINEGKEQGQAVAICSNMYKEQREKLDISPVEMLNKLKSFLSKYGWSYEESSLSGVIENLKLKKLVVGLEDDCYHLYNFADEIQIKDEISPSNNKEKILVFPRGKHFIQKLDEWIEFNDNFYSLIDDSFNHPDIKKPFIDKNHDLKDSYGDVIDYSIEPEGMYFFVQLNKHGIELIRENVYKYHSPAFGPVTDTKGIKHKMALVAISLTNVPALMTANPALQDQIKLEYGERNMDLTNLTDMLRLQDGVAMDVIEEAVSKLMETIDLLKAQMGEQEGAIEEKDAQIAQQEEELSTIKNANLEREAKDIVNLAIENGQYHPAIQELKIEQYKKDKDIVLKELEMLPKKEKNEQLTTTIGDGSFKLTADDREAMELMGLDSSDPKIQELYFKVNKED